MSATGQENPWDVVPANPVDASAARWLERSDRDGWSDGDQAELDTWLSQSPAHMVAYLRLYDAWNRADRLAALRPPKSEQEPARNRGWTTYLSIAATIAVVAVTGLAASNFVLKPQDQEFSTPVGGRESIKLSDGSLIELNTNTAVRVHASADRRIVTLERGEAYFQIRHNAARPFVVMAADGRVVDLGTKFLIRNGADHMEVALLEGSARFEPVNERARTALLKPGDVVVATQDSLSVTKRTDQELVNALGWRRGVLVFDHTTLADAAAELNRYNREKIVIADPDVRRRIIGATIPTNGVEAFTRVAQQIFKVHVEKSGGEIIISR